jgi:hypothetical protein
MKNRYIKAAELTLSYKKFKKYVGNNFEYNKLELIEVLKEMIKEKEITEEYEECQLILDALNSLDVNTL